MSWRYSQGIFRPSHPEKYIGKLPIIYRSSWELRFQQWLDKSSQIIHWGSESVIVPYQNPWTKRLNRYFVDFYLETKDKKKFLVEIKPEKETFPISFDKQKRINPQRVYTYILNQAKWQAAQQFAKKHGMTFLVLTEKNLFSDFLSKHV